MASTGALSSLVSSSLSSCSSPRGEDRAPHRYWPSPSWPSQDRPRESTHTLPACSWTAPHSEGRAAGVRESVLARDPVEVRTARPSCRDLDITRRRWPVRPTGRTIAAAPRRRSSVRARGALFDASKGRRDRDPRAPPQALPRASRRPRAADGRRGGGTTPSGTSEAADDRRRPPSRPPAPAAPGGPVRTGRAGRHPPARDARPAAPARPALRRRGEGPAPDPLVGHARRRPAARSGCSSTRGPSSRRRRSSRVPSATASPSTPPARAATAPPAPAASAGRSANGEVLKTFPKLVDQASLVYTGSAPYAGKVYGDPNRPGGPHRGRLVQRLVHAATGRQVRRCADRRGDRGRRLLRALHGRRRRARLDPKYAAGLRPTGAPRTRRSTSRSRTATRRWTKRASARRPRRDRALGRSGRAGDDDALRARSSSSAAAPPARPPGTGWPATVTTSPSSSASRFPREKTCGDALTPARRQAAAGHGPRRGADRVPPLRRVCGPRPADGRSSCEWPSHPVYPSEGYVVRRRELDRWWPATPRPPARRCSRARRR